MNQLETQLTQLLYTEHAPDSGFRVDELQERVGGSHGDDHVLVREAGSNTQVDGRGGDDNIVGGEGNDLLFGDNGFDLLRGLGGDDVIFGGNGEDALFGESGNDILYGGYDDDILDGGAGRNVIEGGAGNDRLLGGAGDDTFLFWRGDGEDAILVAPGAEGYAGAANVVQFLDVAADELEAVSLHEDAAGGYNLLLEYGGGDALTIWHQVSSAGEAIGTFRFADGQELNTESLLEKYVDKPGVDDERLKFHLSRTAGAYQASELDTAYGKTLSAFLGIDTPQLSQSPRQRCVEPCTPEQFMMA